MAEIVGLSEKNGDFRLGTELSPKSERGFRAEIDTSAPFESVKEAANRFGGIGFWKPQLHHKVSETEHDFEKVDSMKVEEQAAQLERDLIAKERETLDILKELDSTKLIVEELKSKLQKEASELNTINNYVIAESDKENCGKLEGENRNLANNLNLYPSSAPGLILMELKQAKLNLTRTTTDLADIRASVDLFNKKIEKERDSLEMTRERLASNSLKISSVEKELKQTRQKLLLAKESKTRGSSENAMDLSRELQRLNSETEDFRKMGETAKSEVLKAMSDIKQTETKIKTAEIRLVAAKKMKQAARAAEKVALAEIKSLSNKESSSENGLHNSEKVTLSFEEYSSLTSKAREAEELANRKVVDSMREVDEANVCRMGILKTVEEATEEVKTSKKSLEEALNRVEAANKGKLAVEEALRKWRSDHGQKRRSVHNSAKFKNPGPSYYRRESPRLLDVNGNGLNLITGGSEPVLRPTLSIGQILSRKLLLPEEDYEIVLPSEKRSVKHKESLGQMLSKQKADMPPSGENKNEPGHKRCSGYDEKESGFEFKQFSAKRKKFGFARFSLLLAKQSKKKKKKTTSNFKYCSGQIN